MQRSLLIRRSTLNEWLNTLTLIFLFLRVTRKKGDQMTSYFNPWVYNGRWDRISKNWNNLASLFGDIFLCLSVHQSNQFIPFDSYWKTILPHTNRIWRFFIILYHQFRFCYVFLFTVYIQFIIVVSHIVSKNLRLFFTMLRI